MPSAAQLCTFHLGDLLLGIDVREVQEVVRPQELTRVPLAPRAVRGLLNLRGQIVLTIDLRYALGLEKSATEAPMHVVIRTSDGPISLLVNHIGDIIEVDQQLFERPPETLQGPPRELIRGAYKLDDRLLLELDVTRMVGVTCDC